MATHTTGKANEFPSSRAGIRGTSSEADLYTSLEAAVEELHRRRADKALCHAVAEFQRTHPPEFLDGEPRAVMARYVITPGLEFDRFQNLCQECGLRPLALELLDDKFVARNRDKHMLGMLRFRFGQESRKLRTVDFCRFEGKKLSEVLCLSGQSLTDFHHRLLEQAHPGALECVVDFSAWFRTSTRNDHYYLHWLSLFMCQGILFENFFLDDPEERRFMEERILPSFHRAVELFGVKPLIVRLFTPEEENTPICWQYPGELYPFARDLLNGGAPKNFTMKIVKGMKNLEVSSQALKGQPPGLTPYPTLLVELRPSRALAGEIGLFAVRKLAKGVLLAAAHRYDEARLILWPEHSRLDVATRKALRKFCTSSTEGYHAPDDLNFIHPLWYCNHSCDPNVAYDTEGNLHALRRIEPNEELFFDYSTIPGFQPPQSSNRKPCLCGSSKCKGLVDFL